MAYQCNSKNNNKFLLGFRTAGTVILSVGFECTYSSDEV